MTRAPIHSDFEFRRRHVRTRSAVDVDVGLQCRSRHSPMPVLHEVRIPGTVVISLNMAHTCLVNAKTPYLDSALPRYAGACTTAAYSW